MEPFRLTMYEPPPERRKPYQYSRDGTIWTPASTRDIMAALRAHSMEPSLDLDMVHAGHTIRAGKLYLRRTPTAAEEQDRRAQLALF